MIRSLLMLSCLFVFPSALVSADSLVKNGEFAKPITPWKLFSLKGTPATGQVLAEGVLTAKAADASEKPANRQLVQEVKVADAKKYRLDFDAKATLEKKVELMVVLARSKNPSKPHYGLWRNVELTPEWKTHTIYFKTKGIDPADPAVLKFLMGGMKGEISFRKVALIESKG